MSIYTKIFVSWLTPTFISGDGTYFIAPQENAPVAGFPQAYRINPPGCHADEYFLIEMRTRVLWDSDFWVDNGIVIYHVDDTLSLQNCPGYPPNNNGWPACHYKVRVVQADDANELEQGIEGPTSGVPVILESQGDAGDVWTPGQTLGVSRTQCYQSGLLVTTNLVISNITGPDASGMMSFGVSGFPASNASPTVSKIEQPRIP